MFCNNEKKIIEIDLCKLRAFAGHPFKIDKQSEDYNQLKESIEKIGVSTPITVRRTSDGYYEIISGHRRSTVCVELGIEKIPAVVVEMSDMEATLAMVDSNIQRENILPSEKAFAYKMKLEALKWHTANRKSLASQVGTARRSDEQLAGQAGESRNQIQRYIRLTNLEKPLLQMVDDKKIPLTVGVELSYLLVPEQVEVIKLIEAHKKYPSLEQAKELKELSATRRLDLYSIESIFGKNKDKKTNPFSREFLKPFFPKEYTDFQIAETLKEILGKWKSEQM